MRIVRRILTIVGTLLVAVLALMLAVESVLAWSDDRALRRVGEPVDVGGRTLNIFCSGEGSPTVVFESGRSSPGYVWTPTQHAVATFTRACWYDRAGLGWSDPGPDPNWGDAAARDLHALLRNAGEHPPFVLVGHSFGGYIIRLFHEQYPGEAIGMVFVDAANEDAGTIRGIPHQSRPPMPRWALNTLATTMPYFGLLRFVERPAGAPPRAWSTDQWQTLRRLRLRHARGQADAHEGPEDATIALVRATKRFEELPIVVLSQGRIPKNADAAATMEGWSGLQRRFAARAPRNKFVLVTEAGHGIHFDAPARIVDAVRDLVAALR